MKISVVYVSFSNFLFNTFICRSAFCSLLFMTSPHPTMPNLKDNDRPRRGSGGPLVVPPGKYVEEPGSLFLCKVVSGCRTR